MNENESLFRHLQKYSASGALPMHMPGHKRRVSGIPFLEELGAHCDITEIDGFDDLHRPQGVLLEAMEKAARLWQSRQTLFLVNGSTCGILAAVRACAASDNSGKIIMARNCHRSVYNAAELCALEPVYIAPEQVKDFGFCGSIMPKAIEIAVRDNPGAPVILTSPSYEGVLSNISEIAIICHMYGSPLIVDEAHGAHLDLSPYFVGGAVHGGADIVVQSLHKTLTGLTQSALLHISSDLVSAKEVQNELAVFETSSPSYLLMASIDGTRELIEQRGGELFRSWKRALDAFDQKVGLLQSLRLPGHSELFCCQPRVNDGGYNLENGACPEIYGYDRSKIVISCEGTDTSGVALMSELRRRYNIECEMASCGYVVAMTGLLDTDETLDRLALALIELDREIHRTAPRIHLKPPGIPKRRMDVAGAKARRSCAMNIKEARGQISAEYVWAYPPGIPLVVPGEELSEELLRSFVVQREAGVELRSSSGGMPLTVRVVCPERNT